MSAVRINRDYKRLVDVLPKGHGRFESPISALHREGLNFSISQGGRGGNKRIRINFNNKPGK